MSDDEKEIISSDEEEEYETVDITDNETYQVGSAFFENQDNEGLADIVTNLVKVHVALVDSVQDLVKVSKEQVTATNNMAKMLKSYVKKLDEKR